MTYASRDVRVAYNPVEVLRNLLRECERGSIKPESLMVVIVEASAPEYVIHYGAYQNKLTMAGALHTTARAVQEEP